MSFTICQSLSHIVPHSLIPKIVKLLRQIFLYRATSIVYVLYPAPSIECVLYRAPSIGYVLYLAPSIECVLNRAPSIECVLYQECG